MKKKMYVIPGLGETTRMKNYREIIRSLKFEHFEIVPIMIDWDLEKDMTDFINQAQNQIPQNTESDSILGFSFGAYIAYMIAENQVFANQLFCTISPFIRENSAKIPEETRKYFGEKLMKSFEMYALHKGNKNSAYFFCGEKDWPLAVETNMKARELWMGNSEFTLIKDAGHDLSHENYVKEVSELIKKL